MLDIVASSHCVQFQGKLVKQTWENGKKSSSRPDSGSFWPKFGLQKIFLQILPLLDVRHADVSCKLSLYAISRNTNETNLSKWQKTWFWAWRWPIWPKFRCQKSFSKVWLRQSLDIMVSYHQAQYEKKLMIQSWGNLMIDGRKRVIS